MQDLPQHVSVGAISMAHKNEFKASKEFAQQFVKMFFSFVHIHVLQHEPQDHVWKVRFRALKTESRPVDPTRLRLASGSVSWK